MRTEEDWIMRPVLEGCCSYTSLINGDLTLMDVARMNDALDVRTENERRISKWRASQKEK